MYKTNHSQSNQIRKQPNYLTLERTAMEYLITETPQDSPNKQKLQVAILNESEQIPKTSSTTSTVGDPMTRNQLSTITSLVFSSAPQKLINMVNHKYKSNSQEREMKVEDLILKIGNEIREEIMEKYTQKQLTHKYCNQ